MGAEVVTPDLFFSFQETKRLELAAIAARQKVDQEGATLAEKTAAKKKAAAELAAVEAHVSDLETKHEAAQAAAQQAESARLLNAAQQARRVAEAAAAQEAALAREAARAEEVAAKVERPNKRGSHKRVANVGKRVLLSGVQERQERVEARKRRERGAC